MKEKKQDFDIFISYRRSDGFAIAETFKLALANQGYNVFFDKSNLQSGKAFPKRIEDAVKQSNEFIAIVTEDYFGEINYKGELKISDDDDWVRKELEVAIKEGKNIFPVLVDCDIPRKDTLPASINRVLELQFKRYDKTSDTYERIINDISQEFNSETRENAIVGTIRRSVKNINVNDDIFNEKCKDLIRYVDSSNEKAVKHIIEEKREYDLKSRYASFYVLFSYYRRLQDVKKLLSLVDEWGIEFQNTNAFYYYVMVEYYELKAKLSESANEESYYLLEMLKYSETARDKASNNNGMVHSYCVSVAWCMEKGICVDSSKFNLAMSEIDRIISKTPDYAHYYSTKARLLALDGKFEEALMNNGRAQVLETPIHSDWQKRLANYYKEECLIKLKQMEYEREINDSKKRNKW